MEGGSEGEGGIGGEEGSELGERELGKGGKTKRKV